MTPEDELLEVLQSACATGKIEILSSSDAFFRLLEKRFPVCGSKIDWEEVPGSVVRNTGTDDSEVHFDECEAFAAATWQAEDISRDQTVVVIGDSSMNVALVMSIGTLTACLREILRMPQHTYILPKDASWVMVFTMEGDLCFGYAPRNDGGVR